MSELEPVLRRQNSYEMFAGYSLATRRTLTEVAHLVVARSADGLYDTDTVEAIRVNLETMVQETAMSAAVTETFEPAQYIHEEADRKRRQFIWSGLGRTAVQVAESGFFYHTSAAAHNRVRVEVQEAKRADEQLKPGVGQLFISPRMSRADASLKVAKDEHLANDDAIRWSRAVTDEGGQVIGRKLQSLLVRDIPLAAWMRMLKDPNNVFGKAFEIEDEQSALSVMKLFAQMDLEESILPEGPVSIVAEVLGYIEDVVAAQSVAEQLQAYRQDQEQLRAEAHLTAEKWIEFDKELAESLVTGRMQPDVEAFVVQLQEQWENDMLQLLARNRKYDGQGLYGMTPELAAQLELAWQKIHVGAAAVMVGDKRALKNVTATEVRALQERITFERTMQDVGANADYMRQYQTQTAQLLAGSNVKPGGGCPGDNDFSFKKTDDSLVNGGTGVPGDGTTASAGNLNGVETKTGKEQVGNCIIKNCQSPKPTKVGGCSICLGRCQDLFDKGWDSRKIEELYEKEARIQKRRQEQQERVRQSSEHLGSFALAA